MFLFFLSLMIQAIIEREVRLKLKEWNIDTLPLYPEFRDTFHPTTSKILSFIEDISSYQVRMGQMIKEFRDSLAETQELILNMLGIRLLPGRFRCSRKWEYGVNWRGLLQEPYVLITSCPVQFSLTS